MRPLSPTTTVALLSTAAVLYLATWITLVVVHPGDTDWSSIAASHASLLALLGFLVPTVLALVAVVPRLPVRSLTLLPAALVLNIVVGQVIGTMGLPVPLYLDSIGTVLVGVLAGPGAGLVTGSLSALVWGTFNPTVIPFAAGYAMVGLVAGVTGRLIRRSWWWTVVVGAVVGVFSAVMAAPVASFIYGGTAGTGTGLLVTFYRSLGAGPVEAVFLQSWTSDPADKVIVFAAVAAVVRSLPQRAVRAFAPATLPGPDGEAGLAGCAGEAGTAGLPGQPGTAGQPGAAGQPGTAGQPDGEPGTAGGGVGR